MVDIEAIAYNAASLLCALFVLERGADIFIDHTVIIARRTGIPQPVIALLTAGAEWEELAVVVISLARGRPALALGNVIGSAISNILGAFSLGLLTYKPTGGQERVFDRSSITYTVCLLVVTSCASGILVFGHQVNWHAAGASFLVLFGIYIASISYLIARGLSTPPEGSDSDSDTSDDEATEPNREPDIREPLLSPREDDSDIAIPSNSLPSRNGEPLGRVLRRSRGTEYHFCMLLVGLLGLLISSYVLSNAASNLVDELGISDMLFGIVILSVVTTIPEKFIAVLSSHRGEMGIMVATTVGSNIFLLTLCLGIVWLGTNGDFNGGGVAFADIAVLFASTGALTTTVLLGGKLTKFSGSLMLVGYVAFIILEFTVIHKV